MIAESMKLHFNRASPFLYDKGTCRRYSAELGHFPLPNARYVEVRVHDTDGRYVDAINVHGDQGLPRCH